MSAAGQAVEEVTMSWDSDPKPWETEGDLPWLEHDPFPWETGESDGPEADENQTWRGSSHLADWPENLAGPEYWLYKDITEQDG